MARVPTERRTRRVGTRPHWLDGARAGMLMVLTRCSTWIQQAIALAGFVSWLAVCKARQNAKSHGVQIIKSGSRVSAIACNFPQFVRSIETSEQQRGRLVARARRVRQSDFENEHGQRSKSRQARGPRQARLDSRGSGVRGSVLHHRGHVGHGRQDPRGFSAHSFRQLQSDDVARFRDGPGMPHQMAERARNRRRISRALARLTFRAGGSCGWRGAAGRSTRGRAPTAA